MCGFTGADFLFLIAHKVWLSVLKNQIIKTIFASFALFAVTKIIHRRGRKERKVFRIYFKDIMFLTITAT